MAISRINPDASTSSSTIFLNATQSLTFYSIDVDLESGVYVVTCPSSSVATLDFFDVNNNLLSSNSTSSGTVQVTLNEKTKKIIYGVDTGTNIKIAIQFSGLVLENGVTGTLETINSSGTYTSPSESIAKVCLVGGGGRGGNGPGGSTGGGGGGSGYVNIQSMKLPTSPIPVSLGAGGVAGTPGGGGTTNFGNYSALGGSAGSFPAPSGPGGAGGSGGGGAGSNSPATPGGTGGFDGSPGNPAISAGGTGSGVKASQFFNPTGGAGATGTNAGGGGGGIYGGGGGGRGAAGGGGGGGVPGSGGSYWDGGVGGAGRVFILRF